MPGYSLSKLDQGSCPTCSVPQYPTHIHAADAISCPPRPAPSPGFHAQWWELQPIREVLTVSITGPIPSPRYFTFQVILQAILTCFAPSSSTCYPMLLQILTSQCLLWLMHTPTDMVTYPNLTVPLIQLTCICGPKGFYSPAQLCLPPPSPLPSPSFLAHQKEQRPRGASSPCLPQPCLKCIGYAMTFPGMSCLALTFHKQCCSLAQPGLHPFRIHVVGCCSLTLPSHHLMAPM